MLATVEALMLAVNWELKWTRVFKEDAHFQRNCRTKFSETAGPAPTMELAALAKSWAKKRNTIATNPVRL